MTKRRLSMRGTISIGLCVAAASYLSVLFRVRAVKSGGGGGGAGRSAYSAAFAQAPRSPDWVVGAAAGATGGARGALNASTPFADDARQDTGAEPARLFGADDAAAVEGGAPAPEGLLEEMETLGVEEAESLEAAKSLEEAEALGEAETPDEAESLEEAGGGVEQNSARKPGGSSDQRVESGLENNGNAPVGEEKIRKQGGGKIKWPAMLPNTGRSEEGDKGVDIDSGTQSRYYGDIQRLRQEWLTNRARELREEEDEEEEPAASTKTEHNTEHNSAGGVGGGAGSEKGRGGAGDRDTGGNSGAPAPEGGGSFVEGYLRKGAQEVGSTDLGGGGGGGGGDTPKFGARGRNLQGSRPEERSEEGEEEEEEEEQGEKGQEEQEEERQEEERREEQEKQRRAMVQERVRRVELGVQLWNTTYVPPIEPVRRQALIDKWSGNAAWLDMIEKESKGEEAEGVEAGRILYVMTSFDRGQRLGRSFKGHDKLDFILMMMDEMREACEAGFSPEVHLIAAWEISAEKEFLRDRLFCRRTGRHVPLSLEEHPPDIKNDLSIKHRIYMKSRLEDFDVFIQVEDDVILTLNHIVVYQEESELLENRSLSSGHKNCAVPGYIRIEHLDGDDGSFEGAGSTGEEWLEWEIILSRFHAAKIQGAGTYITLGHSSAISYGGNNQGMWMATQGQLRTMSLKKSCDYLNFDESSGKGHVETHSGSIQMFRPNCGFKKVFPARRFESFLVHHRTNNKLGIRGESAPGVPVSLLREWVEQFIRDESFLKPEGFDYL